jgi:hypothetical protein
LLSAWNDLGDLSEFIFFDDFFQTVIHVFLTDHEKDGTDQRTGLELIKGVDEDGFPSKEVILFLFPFHEAMSLPSRDDHSVGFHQNHMGNRSVDLIEG